VQPVPVPETQAVPELNKPSKVQTLVRPATLGPVQPQIRQVPVQVVAPANDAAAILTHQELGKRLNDRKRPAAPAVPTIAPPADIKLSGIAYQDERRARRAVINGFLMQEGGVVSGAVITDILQDRVRFSLAGGRFELSLVSAGDPAPGK
jgi:general secretion pathway protein B